MGKGHLKKDLSDTSDEVGFLICVFLKSLKESNSDCLKQTSGSSAVLGLLERDYIYCPALQSVGHSPHGLQMKKESMRDIFGPHITGTFTEENEVT